MVRIRVRAVPGLRCRRRGVWKGGGEHDLQEPPDFSSLTLTFTLYSTLSLAATLPLPVHYLYMSLRPQGALQSSAQAGAREREQAWEGL